MKKIMMTLALGCSVLAFAAIEQEDGAAPEGIQKVILKIATVETAGMRTQKTWNPPAKPLVLQELPYSEAQIANADPLTAMQMARDNRNQRLANQQVQVALALDAYKRANDHYEAVKQQLEGTVFGKQVILAVDKFAGAAGEYFDSDCIEFFHRLDIDESNNEKFMGEVSSSDTLSAPYFIKLVFDNPRIESGKVEMSGIEIKRTKTMITLMYQVQALNGKMVTSGNVKAVKSDKTSSTVVRTGVEAGMIVDVMEEALAEVARRINKFFVAKAVIQVIGPKKDADFDPEAVTVEVDGVQQEAGEEFSILKGPHTIVAELDGFKQKGSTRFNIKKDGKIKIVLKKNAVKPAAAPAE